MEAPGRSLNWEGEHRYKADHHPEQFLWPSDRKDRCDDQGNGYHPHPILPPRPKRP